MKSKGKVPPKEGRCWLFLRWGGDKNMFVTLRQREETRIHQQKTNLETRGGQTLSAEDQIVTILGCVGP